MMRKWPRDEHARKFRPRTQGPIYPRRSKNEEFVSKSPFEIDILVFPLERLICAREFCARLNPIENNNIA